MYTLEDINTTSILPWQHGGGPTIQHKVLPKTRFCPEGNEGSPYFCGDRKGSAVLALWGCQSISLHCPFLFKKLTRNTPLVPLGVGMGRTAKNRRE